MEEKSTYVLSAYDDSGLINFIILPPNFLNYNVYFIPILQAKGLRPRNFKEEAYLESYIQ